jgi:hypothetical protein
MKPLPDVDVLSAWSEAWGGSSLDRAIALLASPLSGSPRRDLEAAPLGVRDRWLLDLRARAFGPRIQAVAACPRCGEDINLDFGVDEIRVDAEPSPRGTYGAEQSFETKVGGYRLDIRLPTTADLRAVAISASEQEGRLALVSRCVIQARLDGETVPLSDLPEPVVAEVARVVEARDPQADVRLQTTCPACGETWGAEFDIASFLWEEIAARARRVLGEVHVLARAYGWSEADILALPEARRHAYLDLVWT